MKKIDAVLISGERFSEISPADTEKFIEKISRGEEEFVILDAGDCYLQFYGIGDIFAAQARFFDKNGGFRHYLVLGARDTDDETFLRTKLGAFSLKARETLSGELLRAAVGAFFDCADEKSFLARVSCRDVSERFRPVKSGE